MKQEKEEGCGKIESKVPISETDMSKLSTYFLTKTRGPPDARNLQELVWFNVIYYMGRCGRENLKNMKIDTFQIKSNKQQCEYIAQVIKKCNKNYREDDMSKSNEARIYAQPDEYCHFSNL